LSPPGDRTVDRCLPTAVGAVLRAGSALRRGFSDSRTARSKSLIADYSTSADLEAEKIVVDELLRSFPDHAIQSEEAGVVRSGGPMRWLLDPLDGTHNYLCGLPLYGVVLTLFRDTSPEACIIHDAHLDRTAVARRGGGIRFQGGGARSGLSAVGRHTVSVIKDYREVVEGYPRGSELSALPAALPFAPERVLDLWAPCIDAVLFVTGHTGALVADGWSGPERFAVLLAATESGGIATDWDGRPIDPAAPPPTFLVLQPATCTEPDSAGSPIRHR
jgi:myo-inositol-1(or 4)-monophosphatase